MKHRLYSAYIFTLILFLNFTIAFSQDCASIQDGNWNTQANWGCNRVPGSRFTALSTPYQFSNLTLNTDITILENETIDLRDTDVDTIFITSGNALIFESNAKLFLPEDATIIIEDGASLVAEDPEGDHLIKMGESGLLWTEFLATSTDVWGGCDGCYSESVYGPQTINLTTTSSTLPVSLVFFEGEMQSERAIFRWETDSEALCDHFVLERSDDGSFFNEVCSISAKPQGGTTYQIEDQSPLSSNSFYRLKMIDLNSDVLYSDIISLYYQQSATAIKPFIYPKTIERGQILKIKNNFTSTNTLVEYIHSSGYVAQQEIILPGEEQLSGHQSLRPGFYTLQITTGQKVFTDKLIIR